MSKGSSPRNNHTDNFRDNYDDIDWGDKDENSVTKQFSTIEGMIRQTLDLPLSADEQLGPDDSNLVSPRGPEGPAGVVDESETRFF